MELVNQEIIGGLAKHPKLAEAVRWKMLCILGNDCIGLGHRPDQLVRIFFRAGAATADLVVRLLRNRRLWPGCGAGAPRNKPSVLRSSSTSGQWIPYPPPAICQRARCAEVACRRRGYHASGTEIEHPSIRFTVSESSENPTSATLSSAVTTEAPPHSFLRLAVKGRGFRAAISLPNCHPEKREPSLRGQRDEGSWCRNCCPYRPGIRSHASAVAGMYAPRSLATRSIALAPSRCSG